jgi:hypothetical protein
LTPPPLAAIFRFCPEASSYECAVYVLTVECLFETS